MNLGCRTGLVRMTPSARFPAPNPIKAYNDQPQNHCSYHRHHWHRIACGCGGAHEAGSGVCGAGNTVSAQRSEWREIPARYDLVGETRLGTVITQGGASVGVIEHLMAAIAGAGIDDLIVTLDGPEPPILDGDALCYLVLIEEAGFKRKAPCAG